MAERLTDKNHEAINECGEFSSCYSCRKEVCYITQICEKLGQLEDILEKYGIESVEELSKIFSYLSGRFINSVYSLKHKFDSYEDRIKCLANKKGQYYEELYETKQDRDTWKRACELACEELDHVDNYSSKTYTMPDEQKVEYFYQQAKRGWNINK